MNRPHPEDVERARRWLAHEGAAVGLDPATTAAVRVYDKLHAHMSPLVGELGVQLLFVRSAKLTQGEFASLAEVSILEGSAKVRELLQAVDSADTAESAATLFGTFFTLISTFIGDRLALQLLRSAWPMLDEPTPKGSTE